MQVRVRPKSRREGLCGCIGDRYKIAVNAAPEKGKANKRVCELLADVFGIAPSEVKITAGTTRRDKTVCINGMNAASARQLLDKLITKV